MTKAAISKMTTSKIEKQIAWHIEKRIAWLSPLRPVSDTLAKELLNLIDEKYRRQGLP